MYCHHEVYSLNSMYVQHKKEDDDETKLIQQEHCSMKVLKLENDLRIEHDFLKKIFKKTHLIDEKKKKISFKLPRVFRDVEHLGGAVLGSLVFVVCIREVFVIRIVVERSSMVELADVQFVSVILKESR